MKKTLLALIIVLSITLVFSQDDVQTDSASVVTEKTTIEHRHTIGISLFMISNFLPDPADFYQVNYTYRLSPKDAIVVQAKTWTYYEPLGTYGNSDELYPGKVISSGLGVGYRRYYWKNLYSTVQATSFFLQYYDDDDEKIQNGYQLYLQLRTGYAFEFFKKRLSLEPSFVFNYWPVYTNMPSSFEEIEDGAPNYYLFEPGLNIGYNF